MGPTGWIPYSARTRDARRLTDIFHDHIGTLSERAIFAVRVPDLILYEQGQAKVLGSKVPRIWQQTGSCVGAGSWQAVYGGTRVGDVLARNDTEKPVPHFPWATYGVGRMLGGMRRKGEGSFGGAQAKATEPNHFGMLRMDDARVPQPVEAAPGWIKWKGSEEITWSHPSAWPLKLDDIKKESSPFGVVTVTRIKTLDELDQALAQMRGVTIASMWGCNRPRVENGLLVGTRDTTWPHQTSYGGRVVKNGLRFYKWDNQWGPTAHGSCPMLLEHGIDGSLWQPEDEVEKLLRSNDTEVYAHADAGNFEERRDIPWEDITADDLGSYE